MRIAIRTFVVVLATVLICTVLRGQQNQRAEQLLEEFLTTPFFSQQLDVAMKLAAVRDARVLKALEPLLVHDDRHVRANAAFVFAKLGDPRGFEALRAMLTDRSYRPLGQGIAGGSFNMDAPAWWLASQIRADRYYAVHVLGQLKDSRAVDVLVPLLDDEDINYNVAWALGMIGDRRAIGSLITALSNRDPFVRVSAIRALEELNAVEALPQLRGLLNDRALTYAGERVSVGNVAKAAIAKIQKGR